MQDIIIQEHTDKAKDLYITTGDNKKHYVDFLIDIKEYRKSQDFEYHNVHCVLISATMSARMRDNIFRNKLISLEFYDVINRNVLEEEYSDYYKSYLYVFKNLNSEDINSINELIIKNKKVDI